MHKKLLAIAVAATFGGIQAPAASVASHTVGLGKLKDRHGSGRASQLGYIGEKPAIASVSAHNKMCDAYTSPAVMLGTAASKVAQLESVAGAATQ